MAVCCVILQINIHLFIKYKFDSDKRSTLISFLADCMTAAARRDCESFTSIFNKKVNSMLQNLSFYYSLRYSWEEKSLPFQDESNLEKTLISSLPPGFIKQTCCVMAASLLSRGQPHKSPALRLNTWLWVLREISSAVTATVSSPFKWHQTGGSLFQAYKWQSAQVLHLIHRRSQTADRPRTEFSKWFMVFFCFFFHPFKWDGLINFIKARRI